MVPGVSAGVAVGREEDEEAVNDVGGAKPVRPL